MEFSSTFWITSIMVSSFFGRFPLLQSVRRALHWRCMKYFVQSVHQWFYKPITEKSSRELRLQINNAVEIRRHWLEMRVWSLRNYWTRWWQRFVIYGRSVLWLRERLVTPNQMGEWKESTAPCSRNSMHGWKSTKVLAGRLDVRLSSGRSIRNITLLWRTFLTR